MSTGAVLYVLRYFPTLTETFVYREIAELRRRGVPVVIAALGERADGALQDELPDVPVLRAPRGLATLRALPAALRAGRAALRPLVAAQGGKAGARAAWLASSARPYGIQRVHAHFAGEAAEVASVIALLLGVPWSVTVHAVDLFVPRPSLGALLAAASPVVAIAAHHERWLQERFAVTADLVRCGVAPERYPQARHAPRGAHEPLSVVCVARWAPKKGVDALVAAVATHPDPIRLRLVSDAPAALGSDRVRVGAVAPSAIPGILAESDVFALAARVAASGDRDGIPVALMEAMAAGLPVIATAVSGIPELVDDTVGWLLPPDDPAALAKALGEARDPAERARRGAAGRARIAAGWTVGAQVTALQAAWGHA